MTWAEDVQRLVKRSELLEVDMRHALTRELGPRAAASLKYDGIRATWRHGGRTYTATTLVQLVERAGRLRCGEKVGPAAPVQEGFSLPMVRGGSR